MSVTPSLAVYTFCVLEAIWWLVSCGFFGLFPDVTCRLVVNAKCSAAEHFMLLMDMMLMMFFVVPFIALAVMNAKDQTKLKGLAATAFCVTVAQVVGMFFSVSNSFQGGIMDSGYHRISVIVNLGVLVMLYMALTTDVDGPKALPYFSDLWFKPKLFLVIITILLVILLVQNSDFGGYSTQMDVTDDMITPVFVALWGWWSLTALVNIIFYSFVISYGDANEQAAVTGIATVILVASLIMTFLPFYKSLVSQNVTYPIIDLVFIVLGLATLWKHYSDRRYYRPIQTSGAV